MKILKWIGILIAVIAIGGFFMPGTTHVERSIDINAPAANVFQQITEFKNWVNWSPWYKMDPNMSIKYSEPSSGIGASYTWASEKKELGKGKITLLDEKANEKVHLKLAYDGRSESFIDFKLMPKDSTATKVMWTMDMDNGLNPFSRWMGLMMDTFLGPDFEKGLANMKAYCEMKK